MSDQEDKTNELIERITKERGFMRPWHRLLAERDPRFMELYHEKAMYAMSEKNALPRKFKEILLVCLDAVTFFEEGLRIHVRNALKYGATEDEILEALEVCTMLSIHYLSNHLPIIGVIAIASCRRRLMPHEQVDAEIC